MSRFSRNLGVLWCIALIVSLELQCSDSEEIQIRRVRLQNSEHKSVVRRPRSFGRPGSKFVPKKTTRRFQFRSRNKESDETNDRNVKQRLESVAINNNPTVPVKASRRRFTPSTGGRNKFRLNINTRPLSAAEDVKSNVNPASGSDPLNIRPTPSLSTGKYQTQEALSEPAEALHLDNYPIIISSIDNDISGLITVTHALFTLTRDQYEETLTSLSEIVAVGQLQSTVLGKSGVMFAHSEYNHPVPGITELTLEQIIPSRTFVPQSRTFETVYSVVTRTTTLSDNYVPQRPPVQNNFSPRFALLPGLLSHLRFGQGLAPKPAPPSTSYITSTVTKVSTITSDVTEEIIITFLNRPITTNYVRTTTMVVTDIHVSRSPVTFG